MDEKDRIKVTEITVEVSESRIKNTLKEYRSGLTIFNGALTALSFAVAFLTTWISIPKETLSQTITGWILFGLSVVLLVVSIVLFIGSLIRKKGGKGTEKWFLDELEGKGHYQYGRYRHSTDSDTKKKRICNICTIFLGSLVPLAAFLTVFGVNGWGTSWIVAPDGTAKAGVIVLILLSVGSLLWVYVARLIVSSLAFLWFDYDDGWDFPYD
jgi:hypothetical protein